MDVVVWMLVGAFYSLACFFAGVVVTRNNMIDYKERWQQAVKLLENGPEPREKIVLVKPPEGLPAASKERPKKAQLSMGDLHAMSNSARVDIEVNRLKAGLPPRDDLWGLSNSAMVTIENERTKRGWT